MDGSWVTAPHILNTSTKWKKLWATCPTLQSGAISGVDNFEKRNSSFICLQSKHDPSLSNLQPRLYPCCSIRVFKTFPYLSQCDLQAVRYSSLPVDTYCSVQNNCTASTVLCIEGHFFGNGAGLRPKVSTSCDMAVYSQWHCAYWQHMAFRQ
jgi:hypothetical protein